MRIYSIIVLDGRETIEREVVVHSSDVEAFTKYDDFKEKFIIVDYYQRRDYKKIVLRDEEPATLIYSCVYLRGYEILRKKDKVTYEDIEQLKEELTCVIKSDGTIYYMPNIPISIPEMYEILGTEDFTMKIVDDEPQRWATLSVDPSGYGQTTKPAINKVATEMFGVELYGNVIYVNENLVS